MENEGPIDAAYGYQAIADELRYQIRSGKYLPGAFLPTEKDLQKAFGVSRSTVRRAIASLAQSGWADVMPKRGVAAKLGPLSELGGNVAYIDHADLINERVFFGIGRAMQGTGFHLTHVDSRVHGVEGAIEYAANNGFVGAYIWSKEGFPDIERVEAARSRMPIIALDHRLGQVRTDLIADDNLEGAATAVRHLALQGRKRIAVSGMMDMLEVNHDRFSGYLKAFFQSGLTPHPVDFLFCVTSGDGPEEMSVFSRRLLDADRPDAVFVLQDMCVPVVVEAIFAAGLRIPEDIAIAAFGGEMPIQIDNVSLTSMVVDWTLFTDECVRVLIERLHRPLQPPIHVSVPTSLVVRGSCGAPVDQWDPLPSSGVETYIGPRWRLQQEYLQIRSDSVRRQPAPRPSCKDKATMLKHSSRAFTLIELLVVIAIIAILAAILFPVFAQAKLSAKTSVTLSNLKQIGLSFHMYASDSDDGMVLSTYDNPAPDQRCNWPILLQPYTKSRDVFWDAARPIPVGDVVYGYDWEYVPTIGINDPGVSGVWPKHQDCVDWPDDGPGSYVYGRNMGAQDTPASRMAAMPTIWAGTNVGWYFFRNFEASWVDKSMDYPDWSWWQIVWQTRLSQSGQQIPAVYLDGHVNKVNGGKFVSWQEAPDRASYCNRMDQRNLWDFWGRWWTTY